jgi:GT2 family glycosyltransferase
VAGKFLFLGEDKLYVRGVAYGPFRPGPDGSEYREPGQVERDFTRMAAAGFNAMRTYTVPPNWLLDVAAENGLSVMVGLPWEQHVAFLGDRVTARSIERRVRAGVRACAGHPAVLCYAIGNEIPSPIVRWHGARRVERFLERLDGAARAEDPEGLFTYVNYPSTEYLQLPFVDLVAFNIYLEDPDALEAYLARVHNLAGDKPVLIAELGLDSRRHGEVAQASVVSTEVRVAFAAGCAGAFVFSWTDEWHRGGHDVVGWGFGLTRRDRQARPALAAVARAFSGAPFPRDQTWPRVSVVVCSQNGAGTLGQCLDGLQRLEYPNFEIIVVNDGSTDATEEIARAFGVRLITTENRGLSSARNAGLEVATGGIVAYIDDDAYPDPHWLTYLAASFMNTSHVAAGGPNMPPAGDGVVAECVAAAPGGPIHVLLSDREAEHIPGCNMAFRRDALLAIGGFDPQFRVAGDDVDICWRLQERGWTLGFSPAAAVWHHRRDSVKGYWKQQRGYGRAEALLERKWPERYNAAGHLTWAGHVYGSAPTGRPAWRRWRIYQGTWGTAPFQSVDRPPKGSLGSLLAIPEWYLLIAALAALSLLGALWRPHLLALPLLVVAVLATLVHAGVRAARIVTASGERSARRRALMWSLTAVLHLIQPIARLRGRIGYGLTPWRRSTAGRMSFPRRRTHWLWRDVWQQPTQTLERLESALRSERVLVRRGGPYERWDLEVRGGTLGAVRILTAVEEHGGGRQLVRFQSWPWIQPLWLATLAIVVALSAAASIDGAHVASALLATGGLLLAFGVFRQCAAASGSILLALQRGGWRS